MPGAEAAAARDQRGGFAVDDIQVFVLGQFQVAPVQSLAQFSFAGAIGGHTEDPASLRVVQGHRQVESMGEEIVAQEEPGRHAPFGIDRGHVPADGGLIENVIVNQGGRVNQLQHGAQGVMPRIDLARGSSRQEQQGRTQALTSETTHVIDQGSNARIAAPDGLGQDSLDLRQVLHDGAVHFNLWRRYHTRIDQKLIHGVPSPGWRVVGRV